MITKMMRWLLAGLVCLALWPGTAGAQSEAMEEAYRLGTALFIAGRYTEAVPFLNRALELSEDLFGAEHPDFAASLNNLAELYRVQGRYGDAEPLYKRSLRIWEKAHGPEHPHVATSLENLAILLRKIGRDAEAARLETRAREMRIKHPEWSAHGIQA
jgi:tetratricopeptide (TPR) repeat protein